jgi:hypothetical protein
MKSGFQKSLVERKKERKEKEKEKVIPNVRWPT